MSNTIYRQMPILAMVASAITLIVVGSIFHVKLLFIIVGTGAILLGAYYAWSRSHSTQSLQKTFWVLLEASLVFFAGAAYGAVQSWREGWQMIDLLSLVVPTAMGAYLLWIAFKVRRRSNAS